MMHPEMSYRLIQLGSIILHARFNKGPWVLAGRVETSVAVRDALGRGDWVGFHWICLITSYESGRRQSLRIAHRSEFKPTHFTNLLLVLFHAHLFKLSHQILIHLRFDCIFAR